MHLYATTVRHGVRPAPARDAGASSVEYALIVFAIAATMVVALMAFGTPVFGLFDTTCQAIKGGAAGPTSCS
jgi:Flp pilus assembly pilin Flp